MTQQSKETIRLEYHPLCGVHQDGHERNAWRVDIIDVLKQDNRIGYLRISYIPLEQYKEIVSTDLEEIYLAAGRGRAPRFSRDTKENRYGVYCLWLDSGASWEDACAASEAPWGTIQGELPERIEAWGQRSADKVQKFRTFHLDRPLVDFVKVEPEEQRHGIGSLLYAAAALWMQERGLRLHASGCQSEAAKQIWLAFQRQRGIQVEPETGRRTLNPAFAQELKQRSLQRYNIVETHHPAEIEELESSVTP